MVYILALFLIVIIFVLLIMLKQDKKKSIILRMNDRYPNANEYVVAIKYELEKQGKNVSYSGNGHFVIDGMNYKIKEQKSIITDGESTQLTILQFLKS